MRNPIKHSGSASRAAPPLRSEDETPEGADILHELPTPEGVLLSGSLRDLMLWLDSPSTRSKRLFGPGGQDARTRQLDEAIVDPVLRGPLERIARLQQSTFLEDVRSELTRECAQIVKWAEENTAPAARLAFYQVMALAHPEDASLALEVGRLAREAAQYARAESWLRWAIHVARSSKDQNTYVGGYIALGVLYRRIGNHPAAITVASRAVKAAHRNRLNELKGLALHNLFIFASDGPDIRKAYAYVWDAAKAYGRNLHRLAILAHDVASYWCDQSHFSRAAPVIEAVLPRMQAPFERALATSNLARASAGAGWREAYEHARRQAIQLVEELPGTAYRAEALLTIARADALLGQWGRAEGMASTAAEIASRRGEAHVLLVAESELDAIRACQIAQGQAEETPGLARHAERLAVDLIDNLEREAA